MKTLISIFLLIEGALSWITPTTGYASMTHYGLGDDTIAACGCSGASTHYPTAALSQYAYGSSRAFGISCGKCFNLTLLNTFLSDPPFYPPTSKSITIKVTDLCPITDDDGWCSGTETKVNQAGHNVNFDLAFPSKAIPNDFFPSNEALYGYKDFGVWNISYNVIDCSYWAGFKDESALGSVSNLGPESVCCPKNPTGSVNDTCPSYSDNNGIAPDTRTNASFKNSPYPLVYLAFHFVLGLLIRYRY